MRIPSSLPINPNSGVNWSSKRLKGSQVKPLTASDKDQSPAQPSLLKAKVFEPNPEVDFIAAGEELYLKGRNFTHHARQALQGYWQVAQASFNRPQYVDVYA